MRDDLLNTIQRTFEVQFDQAECLYQELLQCTRNKNLVRVANITGTIQFYNGPFFTDNSL